jgi:PTH1 family peptidyl-tRNA hydrolase
MTTFFRRRPEETVTGDSETRLIVGFGNPDAQYRQTRHNVGFMVAEQLAKRYNLELKGSKHAADIARGTIAGLPVVIAEPLTYYNEIGVAVRRILSYYKIPRGQMLAVCDDLDIPFGRLRIRPDGSAGGNGGLKSIIRELGTDDFPRLRVGIGRPSIPARAYVLQRFTGDEEAALPRVLEAACDAVEAVVRHGPLEAMNGFNRDWLT